MKVLVVIQLHFTTTKAVQDSRASSIWEVSVALAATARLVASELRSCLSQCWVTERYDILP